MKVHWFCGYYSDYAAKITGVARPHDPPFWEAYMFCWAVKVGTFKSGFFIMKGGRRLNIVKNNFHLVRPTFGEWGANAIDTFPEKDDVYLVPVPDTDALSSVTTYRTLTMAEEAFKRTSYEGRILDGLRWTKKRKKGHEGGSRKRSELLALLEAKEDVKGKNIVLIDEIVTTGGNLLACQDRLVAAGATVVGAVSCGRSVYDVKDAPYGAWDFDLTTQLQDYTGGGAASSLLT
jgi:predicted amidophosphoribosyltransferase